MVRLLFFLSCLASATLLARTVAVADFRDDPQSTTVRAGDIRMQVVESGATEGVVALRIGCDPPAWPPLGISLPAPCPAREWSASAVAGSAAGGPSDSFQNLHRANEERIGGP